MNNLDKQYLALVQDIIDNGHTKSDRTGTGTISVFGRQIRHKMSDGFPLLTTKKLHWKSIVSELIWFLRGDTNIKYLLDNDVHIWDGDCYNFYLKGGDIKWLKETEIDTPLGKIKIPIPFSKKEFIEKIKTDDEFAKKWGDLGKIYGAQWRSWGEYEYKGATRTTTETSDIIDVEWKQPIDQIANLIKELKINPDSRRLIVTAWNPADLDSVVLPPCHNLFQVYTRELSQRERKQLLWKVCREKNIPADSKELEDFWGRYNEIMSKYNIPNRAISLMWNQRSVDTGLGLPFNIASYGLLLEIIAKAVNMVPDELIGNLGDVHLYSNHVEPIKEQFRKPFPLPTLSINTEFWPTESGECGVGPISALSVFNSFSDDNFCKCLLEDDIQLVNYQSHPTIKLPLSN
jgi:thymidylate synthase